MAKTTPIKKINIGKKKPFGEEILQFPSPHLHGTTTTRLGRPPKMYKEERFAYLLFLPIQLHNSLEAYLNLAAQRKDSLRSIILAGLQQELQDILAGRKVKDVYLQVEKARRGDPKYLLNIPVKTNAILDQIVKGWRSDGITKRSIIIIGIQNQLLLANQCNS